MGIKQALLDALVAQIDDELSRATGSQREVQAGATHEEAKPENDKDTRALEATYLAAAFRGASRSWRKPRRGSRACAHATSGTTIRSRCPRS